jgi:hypothetical protein
MKFIACLENQEIHIPKYYDDKIFYGIEVFSPSEIIFNNIGHHSYNHFYFNIDYDISILVKSRDNFIYLLYRQLKRTNDDFSIYNYVKKKHIYSCSIHDDDKDICQIYDCFGN